jgi:hypothetical protein
MFTLFAIPKPFKGHIGLIQRNAILSWRRLGDQVTTILFGDEPGTAQAAAEMDVKHVPLVRRNRYGTPLLSDLFAQAEMLSGHPHLCYVNADIILLSDFARSFELLVRRKRRFLMVAQRHDLDLAEPLGTGDDWERVLQDRVKRDGRLKNPTNIDLFLYNRGLWGRIPPFAVGRTAFDNWLIYRARTLQAPVIDVTPVVTVIHQNHDYNHAGNGAAWIWRGPEARQNFALAGGHANLYTIWDSTHQLTEQGLNRREHQGLGGGIWSYQRSVRLGA